MRVKARADLQRWMANGMPGTLTPLREYVVLEINHSEYRVVDDTGAPALHPKVLFEVEDSTLRGRWQFTEDDDSGYCLKMK